MKENIKKEIIDGEEVVVKSVTMKLDKNLLLEELGRIEAEMRHHLRQVSHLRDNYARLKKEKEFYEEELKNLESGLTTDELFDLE